MVAQMHRTIAAIAIAACLLQPAKAEEHNTGIIITMQQGIHSLQVDGGTLHVVNGTYQDTTSYKRSMSIYFERKGRNTWDHVPIIESEVDFTTQWFSRSREETTLADALLTKKGNRVYIIAATKTSPTSDTKVVQYELSIDDPKYVDGPSILFKSTYEKVIRTRLSVEKILSQEAARLK